MVSLLDAIARADDAALRAMRDEFARLVRQLDGMLELRAADAERRRELAARLAAWRASTRKKDPSHAVLKCWRAGWSALQPGAHLEHDQAERFPAAHVLLERAARSAAKPITRPATAPGSAAELPTRDGGTRRSAL